MEAPSGYNHLLQEAPFGFFRLSGEGRILDVNSRLANMLGYRSPREMTENVVSFVDDLVIDSTHGRKLLLALKTRKRKHGVEILLQHRDNGSLPVRLHAVRTQDKGKRGWVFEGMVEDIRQLKEKDRTIQAMAFTDTLTGLPNRSFFLRQLRNILQDLGKSNMSATLLYLDIHRFKDVCNAVGLIQGDQVLKKLADRLREFFPSPWQTVGRLQGDDFAVLLTGSRGEEAADLTAELQRTLEAPFRIDGRDLFLTCNIGVATAPDHGIEGETLLGNAHLAMNLAKEKGPGTALIFCRGMDVAIREKKEMEFRLRRALRNDEFSLYYQPQVNLANCQITGVEALLRWKDPERGFVSPESFIPIAEEFGLIRNLGEWVLNTACSHRRQWLEKGLPSIRFSVNLSGTQLKQPDLMEIVDKALSQSQLPAEGLELELTESILMVPKDLTLKTLTALKRRGIGLAIDDFGTGYSSLHYLKHFPIDRIKIDQSFVRDIVTERDDAAIVDAIIAMTRSLGLEVIAEGVETRDQLNLLRHQNCHEMQGFYFCHPLPFDEMCHTFPCIKNQLFPPSEGNRPLL
ncbi:MAG: EAL domain-containing protein [Desulfuromonadaceae bacterium]|nr:EAL domain-containing protein [Desulfuromonadaceae bacterium]